jgi:UDP-N-acetyl-D-mannosaminuronate dehydrogenase|tara:strand:+ start:608 stop:1363 length:756 start_codon:yes stop_codon:yes gene_type:complete
LLKKDIVVGLGEIGLPIFKLLSKKIKIDGFDKIEKLNSNKFSNIKNIEFMHICIPFSKDFEKSVLQLTKKFNPDGIVIHSTISPNTTKKLQTKLDLPIIYSATRGVHKRMLKDLKRYTKFFAVYNYAPKSKWASRTFKNKLKKCGVKTKQLSQPITLELAKVVCDTSYYGWLINFAQISKIIADKENVDYDEMWSFTDEIQKFLKNRPKMFPGFIGGHCVIPNLDLVNDKSLNQISSINNLFKKFLDSKSI